MNEEIVELQEDVSDSPLYSEDFAPVPASKRNWNSTNIAAIWIGMAVCIPTYMLASSLINQGMNWCQALITERRARVTISGSAESRPHHPGRTP